MSARTTCRAAFLSLALGGFAGGCGGGGGGGPSAPAADPVIVGVSPSAAWRGDPVTLTITGTGTGWSASSPPAVDAGSGITVDSVVVESPTSIRVTARVAYDASLGLRLLFVGAGSTYVSTPAFEVKAPIGVSFFSQPFVRASVLVGAIQVRRAGDVVDGPVVAVASNGDLLPLYLDDPQGFILVVPEDAPLGPFDLLVHRTGADGASTFRVAAGSISPRSTVFTAFPMQVPMPTLDGTALHRYTANSACYLEFPMTSSDPTLPVHFLYAHESPFAPPVVGLAPVLYGAVEPGPRAIAMPGETFDVIVFTGHTAYGIDVAEASAPVASESEPNDKSSSAQTLSLPAIVAPATMTAATGDDWYRVDVGEADVGRRLRLVASPGPALAVTLVRGDGAVLGGGSSNGEGGGIDLRTPPIAAAGTIYVYVTSGASPSSPDVTSAYRLFLRLEGP